MCTAFFYICRYIYVTPICRYTIFGYYSGIGPCVSWQEHAGAAAAAPSAAAPALELTGLFGEAAGLPRGPQVAEGEDTQLLLVVFLL